MPETKTGPITIKAPGGDYKASRDAYGWHLKPPKSKTVYYGRFEHVLQAILDREVAHCADIAEVKSLIERFPYP